MIPYIIPFKEAKSKPASEAKNYFILFSSRLSYNIDNIKKDLKI
jgi:hypothetical protein